MKIKELDVWKFLISFINKCNSEGIIIMFIYLCHGEWVHPRSIHNKILPYDLFINLWYVMSCAPAHMQLL